MRSARPLSFSLSNESAQDYKRYRYSKGQEKLYCPWLKFLPKHLSLSACQKTGELKTVEASEEWLGVCPGTGTVEYLYK